MKSLQSEGRSPKITLGVSMESRVKSWESIEEKLMRKQIELAGIEDLDDLVGLRLILLFRSDLRAIERLIDLSFNVLAKEDTSERLTETQFGYQSQHYILSLPKIWLAIPTMADLGELRVEVQCRTLAQHIWAAASHKLQYKQEEGVPPPLRRTIHRVSALLETVDLEFERVLAERRNYSEIDIPASGGSERLNVDLLAPLLSEEFPAQNRNTNGEQYAELLSELMELSVDTVTGLKSLIEKHRHAALAEDKRAVAQWRGSDSVKGTTNEARLRQGVFFYSRRTGSHCTDERAW